MIKYQQKGLGEGQKAMDVLRQIEHEWSYRQHRIHKLYTVCGKAKTTSIKLVGEGAVVYTENEGMRNADADGKGNIQSNGGGLATKQG